MKFSETKNSGWLFASSIIVLIFLSTECYAQKTLIRNDSELQNIGNSDKAVLDEKPKNKKPLRFIVLGDSQASGYQGKSYSTIIFPQLVDEILERNPDFVLFPGDLVYGGTPETFKDWEELTHPLGTRYMVPGNHDLGAGATNEDWQFAFNFLPESKEVPNIMTDIPDDMIKGVDQMDYYVDVSPTVRLISVTTNRKTLPGEVDNNDNPKREGVISGGSPRSLDWFQSVMALESTKSKEHVFVTTHHPITNGSTLWHEDEESTASEWWKSISGTSTLFNGATATAIFTGHNHAYNPNRPDPHSYTVEAIYGIAGGRPSQPPHRHAHGYVEVIVDGDNVSTTFYGSHASTRHGNKDEKDNWSFKETLDTFVMMEEGKAPRGEMAFYQFEVNSVDRDSSPSALSKDHTLHFNGNASVVQDPIRGSGVLQLDGNSYVDAKNIGDQNLQILGDLKISLWAKSEATLSPNNTLLAFGDSDGALTVTGGHHSHALVEEISNYVYQFSYAKDGRLTLTWEYRDDPSAVALSKQEKLVSTKAVSNPEQWHKIEVYRDAESKLLRFMVDGNQLGEVLEFGHLPTGGGGGSLYLGALPNTEFKNIGGIATFCGRIDDVYISSEEVVVTK